MAEGGAVYKEIILKTIREKEWKDGKGFGVWVVQTVKDDKSFKIQVRAGMYRPDKVTGEKVLPKDGLDEGDFKTVHAAWKEVEPLLQIPKGTAVDPRTTDDTPEPEAELPPWMK
ncbi:MAG: hypothetical protein KGZ65_04000 [Sphingomonadales bacterium]|nr:hypothetical protein [Sphingomonadaceae bacterium]MBS3930375.1 hypothetical protein [Sphingomonadales bacterium]